MKKFLQKAFAMLALCLVSMSAMAETEKTVTFDFTNSSARSSIELGVWGTGYLVNESYDIFEGQEAVKDGVKLYSDAHYSTVQASENRLYIGSASNKFYVAAPDGWAVSKVILYATSSTLGLSGENVSTGFDFDDYKTKTMWPATYDSNEYQFTPVVAEPQSVLTLNVTGASYVSSVEVTLVVQAPTGPAKFDVSYADPYEWGYVWTNELTNPFSVTFASTPVNFDADKIGFVFPNGTEKTVAELNSAMAGSVALAITEGKLVVSLSESFVASSAAQNYFNTDWANYKLVLAEGAVIAEDESISKAKTFTYYYRVKPYFEISEAGWTTYCGPIWQMPVGYEGYVVTDVQDGSVVLTKLYSEGEYVPAYCEVLVNGAPGKCYFEKGESWMSPTTPSINYLYSSLRLSPEGSIEFAISSMNSLMPSVFNGETDGYLYKLSYDNNGENLGFYWDSADGKTLTCQPNKAFLAVPASKVSASNGLKIRFAEDEATGINAVATENADAIYNLQGQRVNAAAAGIYVKNGKKFIVK